MGCSCIEVQSVVRIEECVPKTSPNQLLLSRYSLQFPLHPLGQSSLEAPAQAYPIFQAEEVWAKTKGGGVFLRKKAQRLKELKFGKGTRVGTSTQIPFNNYSFPRSSRVGE